MSRHAQVVTEHEPRDGRMTRTDFDAWVLAQPRVHQVPGAEHALWVRWCAETLARGHRIEVELPPLAPPPAAFDDALPPIAPQTLLSLDPDGPLVAYTDGSGTIAEKPCGAGVVIFDGDVPILEASRFLGNGTNNRAELAAVGIALVVTDHEDLRGRVLLVRSDSMYAIGALTRAADTEAGRPNAKLINHIRGLLRGRAVRFEHVPGHSGIAGNERADQLAGLARRRGMTAEARAGMARNGFAATCSDGAGGSR